MQQNPSRKPLQLSKGVQHARVFLNAVSDKLEREFSLGKISGREETRARAGARSNLRQNAGSGRHFAHLNSGVRKSEKATHDLACSGVGTRSVFWISTIACNVLTIASAAFNVALVMHAIVMAGTRATIMHVMLVPTRPTWFWIAQSNSFLEAFANRALVKFSQNGLRAAASIDGWLLCFRPRIASM
jgi:hypothetical protein